MPKPRKSGENMATAAIIRDAKISAKEDRVPARKNRSEASEVGLFFRYYSSAFNDVVISLCVPCREFVAAATSMELLISVERQHVCSREHR